MLKSNTPHATDFARLHVPKQLQKGSQDEDTN